MSNTKALLFDLDGTLVDSLPDLADAANAVLAELGKPPLSRAALARMVGDGATRLVERALGASGLGSDLLTPSVARFLALYEARPAALSRPYPGVPEVLATLVAQGWHCAVCTNKPSTATGLLLRQLGLGGFFRCVIAGDSLPVKKPDPAPLIAALEALGAPRENAAAVGDHANDLRAAAGAGIPAVWARYGYGTLSPDLPPPAAIIDAITELPLRLAAIRRA